MSASIRTLLDTAAQSRNDAMANAIASNPHEANALARLSIADSLLAIALILEQRLPKPEETEGS